MKKIWNAPKMNKLNVSKTAGSNDKASGTYEGHKPHIGWRYIKQS